MNNDFNFKILSPQIYEIIFIYHEYGDFLSVRFVSSNGKCISNSAVQNLSSFFCLDTKKRSKKNQDCARFARKISARTAKSSKLATSLLKQGRFLTLFLLIFRLIGQGRSRAIQTFSLQVSPFGGDLEGALGLCTCLSYGQSRCFRLVTGLSQTQLFNQKPARCLRSVQMQGTEIEGEGAY